MRTEEKIKCRCGCSNFRNRFSKKGKEKFYIHGHNPRPVKPGKCVKCGLPFCRPGIKKRHTKDVRCGQCKGFCRLCWGKLRWQKKKQDPQRKIQNRSRYGELRKFVIEKYGNKCKCCSESIFEFLTIDHVNNDG